MNEHNTQNILHIYASTHADRKKQDLIKFAQTADTPHHSSAPMKRRLIAIGLCVVLIAAIYGIIVLSQQPHNPMSDVSFIEFNHFHAGKFGAASTDTQTMEDTIGTQFPAPNTLPSLPCSNIIIYRLYHHSDMSKAVGVYGHLISVKSQITAVYATYLYTSVDTNTIFVKGAGFQNLPHTTVWNGLDVTYSDAISTKDGNMFKLFFEDGDFFCCLDVYAPANMEITELLNSIF